MSEPNQDCTIKDWHHQKLMQIATHAREVRRRAKEYYNFKPIDKPTAAKKVELLQSAKAAEIELDRHLAEFFGSEPTNQTTLF